MQVPLLTQESALFQNYGFLRIFLNQARVCFSQMTLIWTLEVNTNYVAHELQGIPFPFEPIFARGRKFLSRERCREEESERVGVLQAGVAHGAEAATAGPLGGSRGGRLCGPQWASPPGTG